MGYHMYIICNLVVNKKPKLLTSAPMSIHFQPNIPYFSTNQLVIVDIMLGHQIKVERPLAENHEIVGLTMINAPKSSSTPEHLVAVFCNSYFRQVGQGKAVMAQHLLDIAFIPQDFQHEGQAHVRGTI